LEGYAPSDELNIPGIVSRFDADALIGPLHKNFENCFTPGGAARLFVASFVAPNEPHQAQLGVLTMWQKYTNNEGYCLVFDRGEVEELIARERALFDYQSLDLVPVSYGFDPASEAQLMFQMTQRMLDSVKLRSLKKLVDRRRWWVELEYARELVRFCARQKSPFWQDEREVRIAAIPTEARVPTPPERRKEVHLRSNGKHYLKIGEGSKETIEPIQIIVGPKATQDIDEIVHMFARAPKVMRPIFHLDERVYTCVVSAEGA
jgi:hypothetical protein